MSTIPSLALIPSGYKGGSPGTLYSVLPTDGTGDFDFTRSGNATRVNSEGLIELVTTNVPRLNYPLIDGVVSGCPSLLLEPERINVALYSEDFSNGVYTQINGSVATNTAISPDGTQNADTWTATSGSAQLQGVVTVASGVQYTMSIYLKRKTGTGQVSLRGVSNTSTPITITDEWQRYSVTLTSTDTSGRYGVLLLNSGDEVYVWGAQLEAGSYATSYIPTSGTIETRSAETCNGAGDVNTFNDSEGVLYVETKGFVDAPPSSIYIQLSKSGDVGFNNSLVLQHRNNGFLRIYSNGTLTNNIIFNENIDFTENHKIAVLYKLDGYKLFIDGVAKSLYLTPTQAVFSGLNDLSFDNRGALGWNGNIKELKIYNTELTDQELIALTTI
jgi:hypothetical protein